MTKTKTFKQKNAGHRIYKPKNSLCSGWFITCLKNEGSEFSLKQLQNNNNKCLCCGDVLK